MTLTFCLHDVEHLKNIIETEKMYSFLDKHIKKPTINPHKLSILAILVKKASISTEIQQQFIKATMLVQIALDTHAYLSENDRNETEASRLSKQLSVLGGDYYSSLYYLLLSETEDIDFIRILASAIKNVNEQKMNFHFHTSSDFNDYIEISQLIESQIICSVADYVGFSQQNQVIADLILLDLLITEKKYILSHNQPGFFINKQIKTFLPTDLDPVIEMILIQINEQLANESEINHLFREILNNITEHYITLTEEGSV